MDFSKKTHRVSNIKRFAVISRIMAKHGLGEILERVFDRRQTEAKAEDESPVFDRTMYLSPQKVLGVYFKICTGDGVH